MISAYSFATNGQFLNMILTMVVLLTLSCSSRASKVTDYPFEDNSTTLPRSGNSGNLVSSENIKKTFIDYDYLRTNSSERGRGRVCQTVDVRNTVANLALLRGCRAVEGSVQIVLIDHANETDYDLYALPELREITHYLLFYRVSGLRSVAQLFPNLAIIRGNSVFENYALVIYDNLHLQEVGLSNLHEITRGAVRIEKNPSLCFLQTVNWDLIARWDSVNNYIANNKNPLDCPGPSACKEAGCPTGLCWSSTHCQVVVDDVFKHCDPECLGGCFGPGPKACHSCRSYITTDDECVNRCPNNTFLHMNRRCVSEDYCLSQVDQLKNQNFVVFNRTCIQSCPPGYDFTPDKKGCEKCEKGKCRKVCPGLSIDNVAAAQTLRGCTYINGSLEIAIKQGKQKIIAQEFQESLQSIEEIKGYLKIIRCFPLVNLKFFKNLEIIRGEYPYLENGKYALIVLDNKNLQELWDLNNSFKILNGTIFFHYNPKLCFYHIASLINVTGLTNVSSFEVAQDSNGDKFACNMTVVEVQFPIIKSNSVLIKIFLSNKSSPNLQRYVLYHTEAPAKNLTALEEMDECEDNVWKVRDVLIESDQVSTIQTYLKPFTQYAFYVKTYTVHSVGGQSPIHYIKTLPSQPSPVSITLSYANSSSTIVLQWNPPQHPNGLITYYLVTGYWLKDDRSVLDQRDYCQYPLEHQAVQQLDPEFLTAVENETTSCCPENEINYKPTGEFGVLCDNSRYGQLPIDTKDDYYSLSCNKYFYRYVNDNIQEINGSGEERRNTTLKFNKITKRANYDYVGLNKADNLNLNTRKSFYKNKENVFEIVKNKTVYVMERLQHFAKYIITVRACRQKYKNENDSHLINRCSKQEIITVRTLNKMEADSIYNKTVTHDLVEEENSMVLVIKWEEPYDPNGVIVAFDIEHRRSDLENAKASIECVTYLQYIQNGKMYTLRDLPPGMYTYRLRAVSLAGPGIFTDSFKFEIQRVSRTIVHKLFLFLVMLLITCIGGVCYIWYQKRIYKVDLDSLLASAVLHSLSAPPYIEDSWEIPRENVQILKEIGQGTFGKVYEGILLPLKIPCAIKTTNSQATEASRAFLNETSIMKHAAGVHHIVQLLGVVSRELPPLVVMELMALGDLKSFLRSRRELLIRSSTIILMAAQIADAMFFMEKNKFVHRDLAARNCMVHHDLTVKVGDFGLTRDIYLTDYYRKGDKGLLPIRWMAPESLRDGVFTSRSDVWSYGVVLWEIASQAEQPFRGQSNEQVLHNVMAGETLPPPLFCPEPFKTLMALCWKRVPTSRPSFRQIVARLDIHTNDVFKCVSYYHTVTCRYQSQHDPQVIFF